MSAKIEIERRRDLEPIQLSHIGSEGCNFPMETTSTQIKREMPKAKALGASVPDRIGATPLVRLDSVARHLPEYHGLESIKILAKAEWANPGGSVKDRAAAGMVRDAIDRGVLKPGKTVLDASSGNTGIALAMLASSTCLLYTSPSPRDRQKTRMP